MRHDDSTDQTNRLVDATGRDRRHKCTEHEFAEVGLDHEEVYEEAGGHYQYQEGEESL